MAKTSAAKTTKKPAKPVSEKPAAKAKAVAPSKSTASNKAAPVATKSPVGSPASANSNNPKTSASATKTISAQDRYHMIDEAAYYRAEKNGFQVDPHANWIAAEKEIDELLAKQNIKVG